MCNMYEGYEDVTVGQCQEFIVFGGNQPFPMSFIQKVSPPQKKNQPLIYYTLKASKV